MILLHDRRDVVFAAGILMNKINSCTAFCMLHNLEYPIVFSYKYEVLQIE